MIATARLAAVVMSVVTFGYLFPHDSWRADNVFLVPDLVLCALLVAGAAMPAAWAAQVLLAGFALAAGVFGTSVSSYVVDGEFGVPSALGAVTSAVMVVLLARLDGGRSTRPVDAAARRITSVASD